MSADDDQNLPPTVPARLVKVRGPEATEGALPFEAKGRYDAANEREIGRGGIGRVTAVVDVHLRREVALKGLLPEAMAQVPGSVEPAMARFIREARITARLEHPGVVPVHELGRRDDGTLYYAMKHIRGRTLAEALAGAGSLVERLALLPHLLDVFQTMAFAHERKTVHRDLKPANVMVGAFGETVVLDWGLARVLGESEAAPSVVPRRVGDAFETQSGHALGTPAYMSPEQAAGALEEIDERSDVWSLGAMLFEVLTGKTPFEGVSLSALLEAIVLGDVPPVISLEPGAPPELVKVAERALRKERGERWASAGPMAEALQQAIFNGAEPQRRSRWGWAVGLLASVAGLAWGGWLWRGEVKEQLHDEGQARHMAELRRELAEALGETAQNKLSTSNPLGAQSTARLALNHVEHPLARGVLLQTAAMALPREHWSVVTPHGCVAVARFGRWVACATLGGVDVYSQVASQPRRLSAGPAGWQRRVVFVGADDDFWVLASGDDQVLRGWHFSENTEAVSLGRHGSVPAALVVDSQNREVLSFARDGDVLRWQMGEAHASEAKLPLTGVADAAWCEKDSLTLATNQSVLKLSADSLKERWMRSGRAGRVACGVGEQSWLLADGRLKVWSGGRETSAPVSGSAAEMLEVTALVSAPSGGRLWLGDSRGTVWLQADGQRRTMGAFSSAVTHLAMLDRNGATEGAVATADRRLHAWNWPEPAKPTALMTFTAGDKLRQMTWLDDGATLALRSDGPVAMVGSEGAGALPKVWPDLLQVASLDAVGTKASPRIVVGLENGIVRDTQSAKPWVTEKRAATVLAVSPDFSRAAWGLDDGTWVLWSVPFGKEITRAREERSRALAFNSNSALLAVARGRRVLLFDAQTAEPKQVLEGHADEVTALRWSDAQTLWSVSTDGQVRRWSAAGGDGRVVMVVPDALTTLAVSTNWAAWTGRGGIVYLWSLEDNRLFAEVRLDLGRVISLSFADKEQLAVVAANGQRVDLPLAR